MEQLYSDINDIEAVCKQGGFSFKEWIISGQDIPETIIRLKLPNQIRADEERCLRVNWDVWKYLLLVKSYLGKPNKKP